jgi:hypothetical protein
MAAAPTIALTFYADEATKLGSPPDDPHHPADLTFAISEDCVMPRITAVATLKHVTPDPAVPLQFQWKVTLVYNGVGCRHSPAREVRHPDITRVTTSDTFVIPFSAVRGGDLTVSVSVNVGSSKLTATSHHLKVVGTNPTVAKLAAEAASAPDLFKKLMRHESGLKQFLAPPCPYWSRDGFGGVGLCQLTYPAPSDDQVWSWKENMNGGLNIYEEKKSSAEKFPANVQETAAFKAQVRAFNKAWMAAGPAFTTAAIRRQEEAELQLNLRRMHLPPNTCLINRPWAPDWAPPRRELIITLPPYTDEQLQREALRGYNGWAAHLHEYKPKVDRNGLLVVKVGPAQATGTAEWEQVTAKERIAVYKKKGVIVGKPGDKNYKNTGGDPDYVNNVVKQASF